MTGLSSIPQIAQIPGLQAALDAHTAAIALLAPLASPTFTGRITQNAGTQTSGLPLLNIGGTWSSPGTIFYGINLNVTDTASSAVSELLTLAVGGLTKCYVRKEGSAYFGGSVAITGQLTNAAGTVVSSLPLLNLSQTWDGAGVSFLADLIDITNTASAAGSRLLERRVGGVSKFAVDKDGYPLIQTERMFSHVDANTLAMWPGNAYGSGCYFRPNLGSGAMSLWLSNGIAFGTNTPASVDAGIGRNSAGVIEANNGTLGTLRDFKGRALIAQAGTSTSYVKAGGTLAVDTTQTGNVTTGVDTLQTYSVPANTLAANGDAIPFLYTGSFANNANTKRLILTYGATTLLDTGALAFPFTSWRLEGHVVRTGAATQKFYGKLSAGEGQAAIHLSGTAAETLSGAVTLLLTGEATDTNDVVKEFFKLDFAPAP